MICMFFLQLYAAAAAPPPAGLSADNGRPNEHLCPITLNVMKEPVVAADGVSYEKDALISWFATGSKKSPVLGFDLAHTNFVVNLALKNMIVDWKPGRSFEKSVLDDKPAADIVRSIAEEFSKNRRLLDSAKDRHIVAFLGNTGSGKSTLVNLLAGKGLIVGPFGKNYVLADPNDDKAMAIGTSGDSKTLYPNFIDVNGLRFFDLPGFNDTDGSERNLVNAAFMKQILLAAASVRLVFVAGEDQFTADRGPSVKRMFNAIKQLFVVDGQGDTLVDDGIFVATKVTCIDGANIPESLMQSVETKDKAELSTQLQSWDDAKRLCHIFHPSRGNNNAAAGAQIVKLIQDTKPTKIVGVNVSALYPPETVRPLERMFTNMMEESLRKKLARSVITLSEYDRTIAFWTRTDFWENFDTELCAEEQAVGLLKEFCINPYKKSIASFKKENETKRQAHITGLKEKREKRVTDIEERTAAKTKEVIPHFDSVEEDPFVPFDFAYHKDYLDGVCGAVAMKNLATGPEEEAIVCRYYAGLISLHSHNQMMVWMNKFSGISEMTKQINSLQQRLRVLEAADGGAAGAPSPREVVQRPVMSSIVIPPEAVGHEEFYRRFIGGQLIYKKGQTDQVVLPFAALANPLGGTFDLNGCGDTGQHLSISTGYRKAKNPANVSKVEIWIAPRFLVEKELGTAAHLSTIMGGWASDVAPLGLFWNWGAWDSMADFWHLTNQTCDQIGAENLLQNYNKSAVSVLFGGAGCLWVGWLLIIISMFSCELNSK